MAKPAYEVETTCAGGINQNPNQTQTNQCADALNVWAPNGAVEERPGFIGVEPTLLNGSVSAQLATGIGGGFLGSPAGSIVTLGGAAARTVSGSPPTVTTQPDYWYVSGTLPFCAVDLYLTNANLAAVQAQMEYWNGVAWAPLAMVEYNATAQYDLLATGIHLSEGDGGRARFLFVPRKDWAQTTVVGVSAYWVRFVLINNGAAALTNPTLIDNGFAIGATSVFYGATTEFVHGIIRAQFPSNKRILVMRGPGTIPSKVTLLLGDSLPPSEYINYKYTTAAERTWSPTVAVIPEVGEFYVAHNGSTLVFKQTPTPTDDILAHVEDRDFAIGPAAPWDKRTVAMLGAFPAAKFIMFFQDRLWIVGADDQLYWSATVPYHRVWPALAFAKLSEDDNSPVTGMAALQEFVVITKTDSIWVAAFSDFDAFNIPHYVPRKIVAGTGCVSNGSIQKVGGELVFLSEGDVVAFDGTAVRSVTRDAETGAPRLKELFARITPGARGWAASAHWKSRHAYLLSVPLDGATHNTHTIVWDYKHDTWWLWDVAADFWLIEEGPNDEEVPYFATTGGYIYRLGGGDDDGVPFDAHVTTRRLGWGDGLKKALTSIEVNSRNTSENVTLDVLRNGSKVNEKSLTMALHNPGASDWGTGRWGTAKWAQSYEANHFTRSLRVGNAHHVQIKVNKGDGPLKIYGVSAGFTTFVGRQ